MLNSRTNNPRPNLAEVNFHNTEASPLGNINFGGNNSDGIQPEVTVRGLIQRGLRKVDLIVELQMAPLRAIS